MAGAAAAAAALGAWSLWIEPRRLVVRREELELPAWPAALDGLRVGVLTDLHSGMPHAGLDAVERAADALAAEQPDLVCLLGRLHRPPGALRAAGRREALDGAAGAAGGAPRGVLAVLGNHDWYAGARRIADALDGRGRDGPRGLGRCRPATACGWRASATTAIRGARVDRALMPVPEDATVLLLSHDPDAFPFVPPHGWR